MPGVRRNIAFKRAAACADAIVRSNEILSVASLIQLKQASRFAAGIRWKKNIHDDAVLINREAAAIWGGPGWDKITAIHRSCFGELHHVRVNSVYLWDAERSGGAEFLQVSGIGIKGGDI